MICNGEKSLKRDYFRFIERHFLTRTQPLHQRIVMQQSRRLYHQYTHKLAPAPDDIQSLYPYAFYRFHQRCDVMHT